MPPALWAHKDTGVPNTHPPAHLCCPCSQPRRRSARPQARTLHCGNRPPRLGGTAEAGARHSPPHLSHHGNQGPHRSAEPGPRTAHCGRGIQMRCTSSARIPARRCDPGSQHGHHTASSRGRSGWQRRSAGHSPVWGSSSPSRPRHRDTVAPHRSAHWPQHTWCC